MQFDSTKYEGCPICRGEDQEHCETFLIDGDATGYDCFVCGKFKLSGTVASTLTNGNLPLGKEERALLSHKVRLENEYGGAIPFISSNTIDELKSNPVQLPLVSQKFSYLIRAIAEELRSSDVPVFPSGRHKAYAGCRSLEHLRRLFVSTEESGLNRSEETRHRKNTRGHNVAGREYDLTLAGWKEYEDSIGGVHPGRFGFVAMKFGDETLEWLVRDVIKPKVKSELNYDVIDLRDTSRAGVIDNLMRQQIRDSAFLLADLTHDNSGAYWEAGFGEGLGKPVIYLCEKEKFDATKTHFDTNHCTTVIWNSENPNAFVAELVATIRRSLNLF